MALYTSSAQINCFDGFDEEVIRTIKLDEENKPIDKEPTINAVPFDFSDITYVFVQKERDVDDVIRRFIR